MLLLTYRQPILQHGDINPIIYHFSLIKSLLEACGTSHLETSASSFFVGCTFLLLEDKICMNNELNIKWTSALD